MGQQSRKRTVAVVGSGMAGLVTAFLLAQDPLQRYTVDVFEKGSRATLDAASVSVEDRSTGRQERIDVPMRAFSEGYYPNLRRMYDFLGIRYRRQRMLFAFRNLDIDSLASDSHLRDVKAAPVSVSTYFVHASNNHVFPPIRPSGLPLSTYLVQLLWLAVCSLWFALCCSLCQAEDNESLDVWFRRTRQSRAFVRGYVLPLLSSICTCSHLEILKFPARDVVDYRKRIMGGEQFVCANGVQDVQSRLLAGLKVNYEAHVISVEPCRKRVSLTWRSKDQSLHSTSFDHVILAASPDVVARIFSPLRTTLSHIPVLPITTTIHSDSDRIGAPVRCLSVAAQTIYLDTSSCSRSTEATHVHRSGVMVTTSPLRPIDRSKAHGEHTFARVLRTVKSRQTVNSIFGTLQNFEPDSKWRNGDLGVWLVGAWCWDGMVLLEGCIVSAIRVANALDVDIPW